MAEGSDITSGQMRHLRIITLSFVMLATLAGASFAANSTTSATASLSPNHGRAASSLKLSTGALPAESTLPSTLTLNLKGFSAGALGSSASLCTALEQSNGACPSSSEVGSGTLLVSPKPAVFGQYGGSIPLSLTFYAGPPATSGCLASVAVVLALVHNGKDSEVDWPNQTGSGELCSHAGGVQLSFPKFPVSSYYTSAAKTVTIDKMAIDLGARNGSALWRNPSGCSRRWSGSLALGFTRASVVAPFSVACR